MDSISIHVPDDFHVHLREGTLLRNVVRSTANTFCRALVMPNTTKPILTAADARAYRRKIDWAYARDGLSGSDYFEPLMTIKLTGATTPKMIADAKKSRVVAAKVYPVGVTTNSDDGIVLRNMAYAYKEVLKAMQDEGMVLCVHGEMPGAPVMQRETAALRELTLVRDNFPDLKIVLEHISTDEGVSWVKSYLKNVAGTITAHHMVLTLDDVIGGKLNPHNFCKPVVKSNHDRLSLIRAAMFDDRFFFGSDSAPHLKKNKECAGGAAGVFVPGNIALSVVTDIFERENVPGWAVHLDNFFSTRGAQFYGLPQNVDRIILWNDPWTVVSSIGGVVPFKVGESMTWRAVRG